jgi:hypothetical protein
MMTAPVLALEETRQAWVRDQTRIELHECFDLWLDSLEEAVMAEPTRLEVLAKAVFARRQELTAKVTEALVQQRHCQALDQKTVPCPEGGRLLLV